MKQKIKHVFYKVRDAWWDLGLTQRPDVVVSGLAREEKVFKESILEECTGALGKIRHELSVARALSVHVKGNAKGGGRKYELKATLYLPAGKLYARAADRDLYTALRRVLSDLEADAEKQKGFSDSAKRKG